MVVAPHGGFATRNLSSFRNVIPSVRPVINGVKEQAFVLGIGREIRFGEKSPCRGETGGEIVLRGFFVSLLFENPGETEESLGRDGGGRTVDRFMFVKRFRRTVQVVAQVDKAGGASIPVRNAVGRGFAEIEVGGDAGDFEVAVEDFLFSSEILEFGFG